MIEQAVLCTRIVYEKAKPALTRVISFSKTEVDKAEFRSLSSEELAFVRRRLNASLEH